MYEHITSYLGKLKPAYLTEPEKKLDGTFKEPVIFGWYKYDEATKEFMEKMHEFVPNGGRDYEKIIFEATGIDCHSDLSSIDFSEINGDIILYILFSLVSEDRVMEKSFSSYISNETVNRMLIRLKKIDGEL